jgi:hypothetical protein
MNMTLASYPARRDAQKALQLREKTRSRGGYEMILENLNSQAETLV